MTRAAQEEFELRCNAVQLANQQLPLSLLHSRCDRGLRLRLLIVPANVNESNARADLVQFERVQVIMRNFITEFIGDATETHRHDQISFNDFATFVEQTQIRERAWKSLLCSQAIVLDRLLQICGHTSPVAIAKPKRMLCIWIIELNGTMIQLNCFGVIFWNTVSSSITKTELVERIAHLRVKRQTKKAMRFFQVLLNAYTVSIATAQVALCMFESLVRCETNQTKRFVGVLLNSNAFAVAEAQRVLCC
jgi:hypothetical protein